MRATPIAALTLASLLTGCAAGYSRPKAERIRFAQGNPDTTALSLAYDYDAMRAGGNRWYANKAASQGISIPAIRITNRTDHLVVVAEDVEFSADGGPVEALPPGKGIGGIRQKTGAYAAYLALSPIFFTTTEEKCGSYRCDTESHIFPIGAIWGGLLTLINCSISGASNGGFQKDVNEMNLMNVALKPGETREGYLVFRDMKANRPIQARLRPAAEAPARPEPAVD